MEKLLSKIEKTATCWNWTGSTEKGYGRLSWDGKNYRAHRLVYELLVGEISTGLVLDHLCRNTRCVNPEHLEPVTNSENIRRSHEFRIPSKACKNGHLWVPGKVLKFKHNKNPVRICNQCRNIWMNKYRKLRRIREKSQRAGTSAP